MPEKNLPQNKPSEEVLFREDVTKTRAAKTEVSNAISSNVLVGEKAILVVKGGTPLSGDITVNPAKNSALYLILASLLTEETVTLRNIPKLSDVLVLLDILRYFGVDVSWQERDVVLTAKDIHCTHAPYSMVSKMRASFVALGALVGRTGTARISMPGGCAFGPRPVDRHLDAFRQLGAEILEDDGDFFVELDKPLAGTCTFVAPTVGGTQNIILASAVGKETVVIENAALEPEIADLVTMLNAMGANITGTGTSTLTIHGVEKLTGLTYCPIPDRIEAGTLMLAAAATRGEVILHDVIPEHLHSVTSKLRECNVQVLEHETSITVNAKRDLRPTDVAATEYPGFPTDLQAPFGAFLATIPGTGRVIDHVYPDRFTHMEALYKTGAEFSLEDNTLTISGTTELIGSDMHSADIRAGGALIIAALAARGTSNISGVQYIDRGYEHIAERLRGVGANIWRKEK